MKKIVPIIIAVLIIFAIGGARYRYSVNKYRDLDYTVQKYVTSGLFNKYKLYKVDDIKLSFSDGDIAVMSVSGMESKSPHKNVKYKVFLEKTKSGIWRVKNIYSAKL
ncbi:hypothetical protein HMPREF1982_00120 [Clostridiales bacterium oral taxon 876 str. F0540]|nr:hypothetical protein HMPREF1982_00120 [Clostridiales bacterium oral taxon 876 str. F0540]